MNTGSGMSVSGEELVPVIREVLSGGGTFVLKVTGTSMTPTLKNGRDLVRLASTKERPAAQGEIVFFERTEGKYVLHRICRELPDNRFVINGDAQNWFETIESGQVIAVVSEICRKGRWISCDDRRYHLYLTIWTGLRPVRPWIFKLHRGYKRLLRKG